jgi:hypothetical protein
MTWTSLSPTRQPGEQRAVVDQFRSAIQTGDLQALFDVLAPDVVLVADGGGLARAVRQPIEGEDRVARILAGFARIAPGAQVAGDLWLNGAPALRIVLDEELDTVVSLVVEAGRVTRIYAVRNPDKLARLGTVMQLSRTS